MRVDADGNSEDQASTGSHACFRLRFGATFEVMHLHPHDEHLAGQLPSVWNAAECENAWINGISSYIETVGVYSNTSGLSQVQSRTTDDALLC